VVDDRSDLAAGVIKDVTSKDAQNAKLIEERSTETSESNGLFFSASPRLGGEMTQNIQLVLAPKAIDSSQKVENLREAILHASPDSKVFAFVDSDARPSKDWLRHLVTPLEDESVGVATGYRWFISSRPSFASEMRSAWNASIASALGRAPKNEFCWGGSMAIRRDVFERLNIREKWRGTVSDDFVLARVVKDAGLLIYFVPMALTASIENCTVRDLFEFTTRQMKLTRVYAPKLWKLSLFGSGLFTSVILASMSIIIFSARNGTNVAAAAAVLILVSIFSAGKAWYRLKAVELVLKDRNPQLAGQWFSQLTLWALAPPLYLFNCIAALLSREMTWRGVTYVLVSRTETKVVSKP
jgi:cellulose synthase/poly-beta-1,6-N-acetylglucosamine synthase-like glycosyltransferase